MSATTIAAKSVQVEVHPERGGKITSLCDTERDREWLVAPTSASFSAPLVPGSLFTLGDMCGWDEMVPTIIPCQYPQRMQGAPKIELPDHGELWTAEWELLEDADEDSITLKALGMALPYCFTRRIAVVEARVVISYEVEPTGSEPLQLLWAAHPQFRWQSGTRLVLPRSITELSDVTNPLNAELVAWPGEGLDRVDLLPRGVGRKLYVDPDAAATWARLVDANGTSLTMLWDPTEVPYFGLWLDNGKYASEPYVVLEPTTAYYDDLALASALGRAMTVLPGHPVAWSLEILLDASSTGDPAVEPARGS